MANYTNAPTDQPPRASTAACASTSAPPAAGHTPELGGLTSDSSLALLPRPPQFGGERATPSPPTPPGARKRPATNSKRKVSQKKQQMMYLCYGYPGPVAASGGEPLACVRFTQIVTTQIAAAELAGVEGHGEVYASEKKNRWSRAGDRVVGGGRILVVSRFPFSYLQRYRIGEIYPSHSWPMGPTRQHATHAFSTSFPLFFLARFSTYSETLLSSEHGFSFSASLGSRLVLI